MVTCMADKHIRRYRSHDTAHGYLSEGGSGNGPHVAMQTDTFCAQDAHCL